MYYTVLCCSLLFPPFTHRNLEAVLSPRSPSVQAMTRTLEATDKELSALQRTYLSLKSPRKKRSGRGVTSNLGVKQDRDRFRPRHGAGLGSGARRKKVAKYSLGVHVVLLLLLFLSWLCQPSCCEGFSAISPFSPQLKYVNGPPPI